MPGAISTSSRPLRQRNAPFGYVENGLPVFARRPKRDLVDLSVNFDDLPRLVFLTTVTIVFWATGREVPRISSRDSGYVDEPPAPAKRR
jgi:hypothetical protein